MDQSYKMFFFKISFILMIFLSSCGVPNRNNIYKKYPKGTTLDINILKSCSQLVYDDKYYILLLDAKLLTEKYDPHVLFFDKSFKLISAAYFASERIEGFHNKIIYGYLNNYRKGRVSDYHNDLPEGYSVYLRDITEQIGRTGQVATAIIDSFTINQNLSLKFFVRTSDKGNIGYDLVKSDVLKETVDSILNRKFTLDSELFSLNMNYSNKNLATRDTTNFASFFWNEMYFLDRKTENDFYSRVWQAIKDNHEKAVQ